MASNAVDRQLSTELYQRQVSAIIGVTYVYFDLKVCRLRDRNKQSVERKEKRNPVPMTLHQVVDRRGNAQSLVLPIAHSAPRSWQCRQSSISIYR
jgi:hypothetical protein